MPNHVPAAAEGLPAINRRSLLGGLAAASAASAAGATAVVAATHDPTLVEPARARVNRLADELSVALGDWMAEEEQRLRAAGNPDPRAYWIAHVHPASHSTYPFILENVRARRTEQPWDKARRLATELSQVLDKIDGGSKMVEIYPASTTERLPVLWADNESVLKSADAVMRHHAKGFGRAVEQMVGAPVAVGLVEPVDYGFGEDTGSYAVVVRKAVRS
jgi:hypothetical protein